MMHPGMYTEEDLRMLTEEKVKLKFEFGEMNGDDVERWYDLQREDDYLINTFARYDVPYYV